MNTESVKKVVAVQRQIASFKSMVKSGSLTAEEADILVKDGERRIAEIRGQQDLVLAPPAAPKGK